MSPIHAKEINRMITDFSTGSADDVVGVGVWVEVDVEVVEVVEGLA